MTLETVRQFRVRASDIRETVNAIRAAGQGGYELIAIWVGVRDYDTFHVARVYIPNQTSYRSADGLCVTIAGAELHELNVWLYETQQVLGVQVHGHPETAYHSETDDAYPVATLEGSLSVVLPFFGRDGWGSSGIATYRLKRGLWVELVDPSKNLIEVVNDGAG